MAIDRDPMCSKMIRVSDGVHELINSSKIIPQEPYNDCIKRVFSENKRLKKMYFTTQTKERMEAEIQNFVLNPSVPDTTNTHREIYLKAHPDDTLTQDDIIHHINGNHNDNRVENLEKVTAKEHAERHKILSEQSGCDKTNKRM